MYSCISISGTGVLLWISETSISCWRVVSVIELGCVVGIRSLLPDLRCLRVTQRKLLALVQVMFIVGMGTVFLVM
jgi:hypothetical protein